MPEPTSDRPTLRSRLAEVFRTDAELTAFCMDYFPSVADQFSAGMTRPEKLNLLLQSVDVPDIQTKLDEFIAKRSRKSVAVGAKSLSRAMLVAVVSVGLCVGALGVAATLWRKPEPKPAPVETRTLDLSLPNPPTQKPQVSVVMEVMQPDGISRIVEPADILCSGESFRLSVEVDTPSYLYIAQGREGHGTLLYPPSQSDPVKLWPGRFYSVPDDAQLELDSHVGLEQLFLLASPQLLSASAVVQFVEQALRSAEPPSSPRRDRSCSTKITKNPDPVRTPPTASQYKEIVLRQNLPRQVLTNTTLVRIPIFHR